MSFPQFLPSLSATDLKLITGETFPRRFDLFEISGRVLGRRVDGPACIRANFSVSQLQRVVARGSSRWGDIEYCAAAPVAYCVLM